MKKKLLATSLFGSLLIPLLVVIVFGYPALGSEKFLPDRSSRCFIIGDVDSLLTCYAVPIPKIKGSYLATYFADFKYVLVIAGLSTVVINYCAIWLLFKENEEN